MANSVSNLNFKYTADSGNTATGETQENQQTQDQETISFEKQAQEAKEKKEKTKAAVEQKLSTTPIQFGMVSDPIKTAKAGAGASALPIGQSTAKTIDRFSVDQICADIDGYEEVQEDSGIKSLISNFMSKFSGNTTANVNSTETQSLPAYSDGGLMDVPEGVKLTDDEVKLLEGAGISADTINNTAQASTTDKTQTQQLEAKTSSFAKMQEIQKKMADPNVSAEEKTKLMAEAQNLFNTTPKTTDTLPTGVVNTSAALTENMNEDDFKLAKGFVSSHATGFDSTSPEFTALPQNVQDYITATDKDAKQNHKNGVKPADYKLPSASDLAM